MSLRHSVLSQSRDKHGKYCFSIVFLTNGGFSAEIAGGLRRHGIADIVRLWLFQKKKNYVSATFRSLTIAWQTWKTLFFYCFLEKWRFFGGNSGRIATPTPSRHNKTMTVSLKQKLCRCDIPFSHNRVTNMKNTVFLMFSGEMAVFRRK